MNNMWQDAWERFNEQNYRDHEDDRSLSETYLDYKMASEGIYPDDPNYDFWRQVFNVDLKYDLKCQTSAEADDRKAA